MPSTSWTRLTAWPTFFVAAVALVDRPVSVAVVGLASKPFYTVADRILGTQFLQDVAEFFILFQSMYDGFVERSLGPAADREPVHELHGGVHPEAAGCEAEYFLRLLEERRLNIGALVLNKALPEYLLSRDAAAGSRLVAEADDVAEHLAGLGADRPCCPGPARSGRAFTNYRLIAPREAEQRAELSDHPGTVVTVPYFTDDICDVAGLLRLGDAIWR
jgi:hypothetical protein